MLSITRVRFVIHARKGISIVASVRGATTECRATLTSTKRAGSFGSAVDVRTMNNLYGIKCWVHIFSGSFGSFGSAVDIRLRSIICMALSVGFINLAARLARQWM